MFFLPSFYIAVFIAVGFLPASSSEFSNGDDSLSSEYYERIDIYRENVVSDTLRANITQRELMSALPMVADQGLLVDSVTMKLLLNTAVNNDEGTVDFEIMQMIRLLLVLRRKDRENTGIETLSSNTTKSLQQAEELFLPFLQNFLPFWYTKDLVDVTMHTENHMILWMSSAYLLRQEYGWEMDDNLDQRLEHFLNLKINYGFYEFLSYWYMSFTFYGLSNLADFSDNTVIQSLAEQVGRQLLTEHSRVTNSHGYSYCTGGRNAVRGWIGDNTDPDEYYFTGYHRTDYIMYLTTGKGFPKQNATRQTAALATSRIDYSDVGWTSSVDMSYTTGHTMQQSIDINADQDQYDRYVYQLSFGCYLQPQCIDDTVRLIKNFAPIRFGGIEFRQWMVFLVPAFLAPAFSWLIGGGIAQAQLLAGPNEISVYKENGAMLSSTAAFFPGEQGFQSFPWMAVVDDIAVWTLSGGPEEYWQDRSRTAVNSHLPSVQQTSNVALIPYYPKTPKFLSSRYVSLYWDSDRYDDVRRVANDNDDNNWIVGRRGDSYVGVYRPCEEEMASGWYSCGGTFGRQVWAAVVGEVSVHGSFDEFLLVIEKAKVTSSFRMSFFSGNTYTTSITVDNQTIEIVM